MSEWKNCTLGDLGEVVGGGTPSTKKPEYYGGDIAWITPKDLSTFSGRFIKHGERNITEEGLKGSSARLMPKNTILFSSRAPIGYVAIAENQVSTNQGFKSIVPNYDTDYLFLYYLLKFNKDKIENMGSGTTFKEVSGKTVKAIDVTVPSNKEKQHEIAKILGSLDDKIENNRKINHHLEQIAKAIFYEKFGNQVPNGLLGDLASVSSGKRPPIKVSERTATEDIPILGAASIMGYTSKSLYSEKILVTGRVGTHGIIQRYNRPCWPSDNALVLKSDDYELVYQNLLSIDFSSMNRGSTQPLITQTDLKNVAIYIPTQIELSDFEDTVGTIMQQYESNIVANESLVQLRDSLLPKLMSGEISVTD
ncbi:restriction endonuclease subunit S [Lactococcus sp. SK2-659]|uniref:restriction endonuclease subunit S n=1 Tax=Lactococcus sp. SK2-659 TaxID=2879150 RepID=UPI001CDC6E72|nr:restriction endonuclease subunit S [Lactococcus sp. SK2-659]MCA2382403.1 restriction endonuclease subunit S [Lactococcus sp. SK2-659]